MSLAHLSDVTFAYPGKDILRNASLLIHPRERLALLGPNGLGKSTILRLLAGELAPDSGDARVLGQTKVAYLHQGQGQAAAQGTVEDVLLQPFAELQRMHVELGRIEHTLAADPAAGHDEALLRRYGDLQERYRRAGGYDLDARVKRLLADVGFAHADLARPANSLSGGERGRIELAKVLLQEPDLLLLDEPTNHLDVVSVERLEAFLQEFTGAFLLISHDRAFIQATCGEIIELENRTLVRYPCRYDKYVGERAERLERLNAAHERQREFIDKTEDFIRRNIAGQATKQAQSRRKMLDRIETVERVDDAWAHAGKIGLAFEGGDQRTGKEVIRAPELAVGIAERRLLAPFCANIYRGDRVGIVGKNGSGKTTLLRTLLSHIPPWSGTIELGGGVKFGYFDQKLSSLADERSLIDEIRMVRADLNEDTVRQYLARFRFFGDDPFRSVGGLSGGERSRLAMAKLMLEPRNVLILDEPTNHLDIPARETLEEALGVFSGTLIAVSHDRYFIDRVCDRLFVVEEGAVALHLGNYTDYRARMKVRAAVARKPAAPTATATPAVPPSVSAAARSARKGDDRERRRAERRVADLEQAVARLESELAAIRVTLAADPGGDWQKLHQLADQERALDADMTKKMGEWERASATLQNLIAREG